MELAETLAQAKNIKIDIGNLANTGLEFGLRTILPDFIEDDIIEIKDTFIEEGFIDGIKNIIDKAEDIGKSITGIFTGKFETVEQIKRLIQKDGILEYTSDIIDSILKKMLSKKIINKSTYNLIKTGKKEIINSLEDQLEGYYKTDEYSIEDLEKYCNEWKESFKQKDYQSMENTMKKINRRLEKNKILEKTIEEARNIEKIQEYISKKGSIDNLSEKEKELLEKIK